MLNKIIAIVDDDEDILKLVSLHLKKANFRVKEFVNPKDFKNYINTNIPDLLILDLMLPNDDGIEICKNLRANTKYDRMSIIMLTARGEEIDRIMGLELGADDYITKPFSPRELVSRVKAIFRREERLNKKQIITIGENIILDINGYTLIINGKKINLTTTEFKLLSMLALGKGNVFSREQILKYLWNDEKFVIDRTVDVHVRHIRQKLGKYGNIIKNIRGIGYKLEI